MRKKVLSIAVVMPLLLLVSLLSMAFTRSVSLEGQEAVREMERYLRAGEPEAAQQALTALCARWERVTPWLQGWVCHRDTDAVAEHLRGAQVGLTLGDETLFFSHTAALAEALEHLHHRDDVTLSNLL